MRECESESERKRASERESARERERESEMERARVRAIARVHTEVQFRERDNLLGACHTSIQLRREVSGFTLVIRIGSSSCSLLACILVY